jgi:hypothetical protein
MTIAALALVVSLIALPTSADDLADAQDQAVLQRTLYGYLRVEDCDEEQAASMVAAATRIFERRKEQLERQHALVDEGLAPAVSIAERVQAVEDAKRVLDLAESRAQLVRQLAEIARMEAEAESLPAVETGPRPIIEKFTGGGRFLAADFDEIEAAYRAEFGAPIPVSARGATRFHRALGFDHRGRIDVAVDPDRPEGVWLRNYLRKRGIPYYAFRAAVRGKATAPHIHIGPPSERLARVR